MSCIIHQSKMNFDTPYKYVAAKKYLNEMQLHRWYAINKLPWSISFEIIDLIDRGDFQLNRKVIFDEFFEYIMIINSYDEIDLELLKKRSLQQYIKDSSVDRFAG